MSSQRSQWPQAAGNRNRKCNALPLLLLLAFMSMITGCADQNHGNTSVRVAPLNVKDFSPSANATFPMGTLEDVGIALSDLKGRELMKDESIRVSLRRVHIAEFTEGDGSQGEIAVLVTVKETDAGAAGESIDEGRVVYYQSGTDRHSDVLEFDMRPVYGPIKYTGGRMYIRVSLIELDEADNARNASILSTLAELGSVAYVPASPVLSVLEKVGSEFISANGNDVDMDFRLGLSGLPKGEVDGDGKFVVAAQDDYVFGWLRTGHYILVRAPENKKDLTQSEWARLRYDPGDGTLYEWEDGVEHAYLENTYIILTIDKNMPSEKLDNLQTLTELMADLKKKAAKGELSGISDALTQVSDLFKKKEEGKKPVDSDKEN